MCVSACVFQFDSSLHWFQSRMNLVNGLVKSNYNSWASWLEPGWSSRHGSSYLAQARPSILYCTRNDFKNGTRFLLAPAIYKSGSEHRTPSPSTGWSNCPILSLCLVLLSSHFSRHIGHESTWGGAYMAHLSPGPDFWTSYPLVLGFLQVVRHGARGMPMPMNWDEVIHLGREVGGSKCHQVRLLVRWLRLIVERWWTGGINISRLKRNGRVGRVSEILPWKIWAPRSGWCLAIYIRQPAQVKNFWKVIGKAEWLKLRMCRRKLVLPIPDDCLMYLSSNV